MSILLENKANVSKKIPDTTSKGLSHCSKGVILTKMWYLKNVTWQVTKNAFLWKLIFKRRKLGLGGNFMIYLHWVSFRTPFINEFYVIWPFSKFSGNCFFMLAGILVNRYLLHWLFFSKTTRFFSFCLWPWDLNRRIFF